LLQQQVAFSGLQTHSLVPSQPQASFVQLLQLHFGLLHAILKI